MIRYIFACERVGQLCKKSSRFVALCLALYLVLCLLPAAALADGPGDTATISYDLNDGPITIDQSGVYTVTQSVDGPTENTITIESGVVDMSINGLNVAAKEAQMQAEIFIQPNVVGQSDPVPVPDDALEISKTTQTAYAILQEQNPDFAAWLQVPGTQIDYPVMYTPEEPEYYLRRSSGPVEI